MLFWSYFMIRLPLCTYLQKKYVLNFNKYDMRIVIRHNQYFIRYND